MVAWQTNNKFLSHLQGQSHREHIKVIKHGHDQGMGHHSKILLINEGMQLAYQPKLVAILLVIMATN